MSYNCVPYARALALSFALSRSLSRVLSLSLTLSISPQLFLQFPDRQSSLITVRCSVFSLINQKIIIIIIIVIIIIINFNALKKTEHKGALSKDNK